MKNLLTIIFLLNCYNTSGEKIGSFVDSKSFSLMVYGKSGVYQVFRGSDAMPVFFGSANTYCIQEKLLK